MCLPQPSLRPGGRDVPLPQGTDKATEAQRPQRAPAADRTPGRMVNNRLVRASPQTAGPIPDVRGGCHRTLMIACPVMEPALGPGARLWEAGPPPPALTGLGALPPETAFHTEKRPRFVRVFAKLHKNISLLQTEQFFKKAENFSACVQQEG